jgi:hypothetical protein
LAYLLLRERTTAVLKACAAGEVLAAAVGRWWADRTPGNAAGMEAALRAYRVASSGI